MGAVRIPSQTAVRIMCGLDVEVTRGVLLMNRSHRNYRVRRGVGGGGGNQSVSSMHRFIGMESGRI